MQELESKREAARLRLKMKNEERQKRDDGQKDEVAVMPLTSEKTVENSNKNNINSTPTEQTSIDKKEHFFIAFARVFSGTLRIGQKVYVLGPKYDPSLIYDSDEVGNVYVSELFHAIIAFTRDIILGVFLIYKYCQQNLKI